MGWVFLKTARLPLGARVLNYGMEGADVKELQELLKKSGFYSASSDGVYGALTREAVLLFQKNFALKTDGVAGRQVIEELKTVTGGSVSLGSGASSGSGASGAGASGSVGRIIYTIKTGDNLEKISRKFGVNPAAWKGLFHKGTTLKKIYPGMKLLLCEKAVFTWDTAAASTPNKDLNHHLTGEVKTGWRFDEEGNVSRPTDAPTKNSLCLIQADSPAWENVFLRQKLRWKLTEQLRGLEHLNYGFDLRQAPLNTIPYWVDFIKFILRQNPRRKNIKFLLLPLINSKVHPAGITRSYWMNLPLISRHTQILMLEPELDSETPLTFINSAQQARVNLRRLVKMGISHQCALVCETGAWDWDLEDNRLQSISRKKARLIRGMFPRETEYSREIQYTVIHYTHRSRPHCLIYRDEMGWDDSFKQLNRFNFYGIVIQEFHRLGDIGLQLMSDSFAVLKEF